MSGKKHDNIDYLVFLIEVKTPCQMSAISSVNEKH